MRFERLMELLDEMVRKAHYYNRVADEILKILKRSDGGGKV